MGVLGKVKTVLRMKGFEIYDRPYELNIVGRAEHCRNTFASF